MQIPAVVILAAYIYATRPPRAYIPELPTVMAWLPALGF